MGADNHDWTVLRNAVKNLVAEHPMIAACALQAIGRRQSEARAWEPVVRAAGELRRARANELDYATVAFAAVVDAIPEEHRP